jgi:hypothetical protein
MFRPLLTLAAVLSMATPALAAQPTGTQVTAPGASG